MKEPLLTPNEKFWLVWTNEIYKLHHKSYKDKKTKQKIQYNTRACRLMARYLNNYDPYWLLHIDMYQSYKYQQNKKSFCDI